MLLSSPCLTKCSRWTASLLLCPENKLLTYFLAGDGCGKALILCKPVQNMRPHLSKLIRKITQPSIFSKPILFIKPYDLVDGFGRTVATPKQSVSKDVVTKRALVGANVTMTCLRCGGETTLASDVGASGNAVRWRAWERIWALQCICGGNWRSSSK